MLPNLTATTKAVEWIFSHAAATTGAMPEFVPLNGIVPPNAYGVLDSGAFAVKLAAVLVSSMGGQHRVEGAQVEPAGQAWFLQWAHALSRGLNATTLGPTGLPWIDPANIDPARSSNMKTVNAGGDVLYSSVLYWNATSILADLYTSAGPAYASEAVSLRAQAAQVRAQITKELWNGTLGAFVAATELESDRISVWGNALAAASGLASPSQATAIYEMLIRNEGLDVFWEGQVR
jgi:hypothetical protein